MSERRRKETLNSEKDRGKATVLIVRVFIGRVSVGAGERPEWQLLSKQRVQASPYYSPYANKSPSQNPARQKPPCHHAQGNCAERGRNDGARGWKWWWQSQICTACRDGLGSRPEPPSTRPLPCLALPTCFIPTGPRSQDCSSMAAPLVFVW